MTKPLPYRILRMHPSIGEPDLVLSEHRKFETAQRAFRRLDGPARLVGPDGSILDHRIL